MLDHKYTSNIQTKSIHLRIHYFYVCCASGYFRSKSKVTKIKTNTRVSVVKVT